MYEEPEGAVGRQTAGADAAVQDDLVDEEAVAQATAREGIGGEAPLLQSPLRENELSSSTGRLHSRYSLPFGESLFAHGRKAARIILQLGLIVAVCLAGERLSDLLPVDVPSNICSMVLLLVFMVGGVIKMECISDAADFLLDNMAVFFVPAAVAVMGVFDQIEDVLVKLVAITFLTTIIVFFVTSFTVSTVANLMARREARRQAVEVAQAGTAVQAVEVAQVGTAPAPSGAAPAPSSSVPALSGRAAAPSSSAADAVDTAAEQPVRPEGER